MKKNHLVEIFSNSCPTEFIIQNKKGCCFKSLIVAVVTEQLITEKYLHVYDRYNIINLKCMKGQSDVHIQ